MNRPRILVTGSRAWVDADTIRNALRDECFPGAVLVSGACPSGADAIAERVWNGWGMTVERHPADWAKYGRRAGFVRNAHMIDLGADVCLAFIRAESRGASHTLGLATDRGIRTRVWRAA